MARDGQKPLVIIGSGEIALLARAYFELDSPFTPVAFSIGENYAKETTLDGLPLLPIDGLSDVYPPKRFSAFVAIGDSHLNRVRTRYYELMKKLGYELVSYISSRCFVWPNVDIGENCLVLEDNTLQPFVSVGNNVILWSGNHIGHRTRVDDHVFITSHVVVSGFCVIGRSTYIGVNSSIANNVSIAEDNYIAMATAIHSSTEVDAVYQGNPAEKRKVAATRFCRVPRVRTDSSAP